MVQMKRYSNYELLRLLFMYMIVFIHANAYLSGRTWTIFNGVVNGICNMGVTCFILISGYFGLQFSLKKIWKMECMMISFSLLETLILYILMPQEMQGAVLLEQLVKSFFPMITRKYWFYSCYVCLVCLSRYINNFIDKLKKEEFAKLLGMLLLFFSVFPTIFYFEIIPDNGKGLFQMIIIYLLGRYLRIYGVPSLTKGRAIVLFCVLWLVNGISHEIPFSLGGIYHHLCKDNSITNIIMAIILFSLMGKCTFQSDMINKMAKYVFAVFALNNSLVSAVMYLLKQQEVLQPSGWSGAITLIVLVMEIMIFCILIGVLREVLVGKIENKMLNRLEEKIMNSKNLVKWKRGME